MASKPGLLSNWPWEPLGNFKYLILAPWVIHSAYSALNRVSEGKELNMFNLLLIPFLLTRMLHTQIWLTISRHHTAKGDKLIVEKPIEFEQVDRENNWDDHIIFNGILFYLSPIIFSTESIPIWRIDSIIITILLHIGPVEFLYYWLHRALHHHYLYSRYHSHHHSSIVTQPITSVIHPFAEHIMYYMIIGLPYWILSFSGMSSLVAIYGYATYIDFMNNMGHCNFEFIPTNLFTLFPFIKFIFYTPSYHSLHHTQFTTNYSLFMPFYDYIYHTCDKSSDSFHEICHMKKELSPDVVHLTHLTTKNSIYHLRLGIPSWASIFTSPLSYFSTFFNCLYDQTFVLENNTFYKFNLQTWVLPRYINQYSSKKHQNDINDLIDEAIQEANGKGVKVLSLGLLNQIDELNRSGKLYLERYPKLKTKVVDGSSLTVAVVLNSLPKGTTQVVFRGKFTKVGYAIVSKLFLRGIQVLTLVEEEYVKLKLIAKKYEGVVKSGCEHKIWLVGEGLTKEDQLKAPKGTKFIPFSQLQPNKVRKDCYYHYTPAMMAPKSLANMDSCENWLPRRAMSSCRVAGIIHGLEGWNVHECGHTLLGIDNVWQATLSHGFTPLPL